jgi:hypothetical protein
MANQIAYGFMNLQDRFKELILTVGIRTIDTAITATRDEHERLTNQMLDIFCERVTDAQLRYKVPAVARLQPMDENGRARPIKGIGHYDVAFPLYTGAAAWGANWLEREKWTVEDVNNQTNTLLTADAIWMRDRIYAAVFQNADWVAEDDFFGALTVKPLANGDGVLYPFWNAGDFGNTDNHFFAQAAAISDSANPFFDLVFNLRHHPENQGDVVAFIPSNLRQSVMGLSTFHLMPDPNLQPGSTTPVVIGGFPPNLEYAPGRLMGYEANRVWIVEWTTLPDNYIVAMTLDGPKPLAMREEQIPSLRGFREIATREDHPFWESQWFRRAGFGAYNRTSAAVLRVGNASYAPPADYALPVL